MPPEKGSIGSNDNLDTFEIAALNSYRTPNDCARLVNKKVVNLDIMQEKLSRNLIHLHMYIVVF